MSLILRIGKCLLEGSGILPDNAVEVDPIESDSDEELAEVGQPSELRQVLNEISQVITSLYRLFMTVRKPTRDNRYTKLAANPAYGTSFFEPYDIDYVRNKFPTALAPIVDRLGKAILRRRQYLKYRQRHAGKLAYSTDEQKNIPAPSETIATSLHDPEPNPKENKALTMARSSGGWSHDQSVGTSPTFMTETSHATSIGRPGKIRMPKMPSEAAEGQVFECPLCHQFTTVLNIHQWRRHVYRDLQCYICTFEACTNPDQLSDKRHDWFLHELQDHRKLWICNGHCEQIFRSSAQLVAHIDGISGGTITEAQIPVLEQMHAIPIGEESVSFCSLCNIEIIGRNLLEKHLGNHLEELALFSLPTDLIDSDDEESQGAVEGDEVSSVGSEKNSGNVERYGIEYWTEQQQSYLLDSLDYPEINKDVAHSPSPESNRPSGTEQPSIPPVSATPTPRQV